MGHGCHLALLVFLTAISASVQDVAGEVRTEDVGLSSAAKVEKACPDYLNLRHSSTLRWIVVACWITLWFVCVACPTKPMRVCTFALIAAVLIINATATPFSGCFILYGPWNMFHRPANVHTHTPDSLGVVLAITGCLLATFLFFCKGGVEVVSRKFAPSKPSTSLALVRVLMPLILILFDYHIWLMIGKGTALPFSWLRAVTAIACLTLLLGLHAQLSSLVLGIIFTLSVGTPDFKHHFLNCSMIFLIILAFTPCGSLFSLDSTIARFREEKQGGEAGIIFRLSGTGVAGATVRLYLEKYTAPDGELGEKTPKMDSNWAKPLMTLHVSLIYFWAGCDKFHAEWFNGSALRTILLERKPLDKVLVSVLQTDDSQLLACSMMTFACIAVELLLPFLLWNRKYNPYGVFLGFLMHLGMSIMCGNLGAYTMVSWTLLIATLDDDYINKLICGPWKFAIVIAALVLVMEWARQTELSTSSMRFLLSLTSGLVVLTVSSLVAYCKPVKAYEDGAKVRCTDVGNMPLLGIR